MLDHLQENTRDLHDEIESDNLGKKILDHSIDQHHYEIFLRQNFEVYKSVEDFINARYNILPDSLKPFSGYTKTNLLASDIQGFSSLPLPSSFSIAGERTVAACVGRMYVLEGSMLGGLMMSKHLELCEKINHIEVHHFYSGDGKEKSKRWKSFQEAVKAITFNKEDREVAARNAIHTFELFKKAFDKNIFQNP